MDPTADELKTLAAVVRELREDFDSACLALASDIASASDPSERLDLIIALSAGRSSGDGSGEGDQETPETDDDDLGCLGDIGERVSIQLVPQLAEILVNRSFETAQSTERVHVFLRHALAIGAQYLLQPGAAELVLPSLVAMLDAHSPFYLYHNGRGDGRAREVAEDAVAEGEDERETAAGDTARTPHGAWRFVRPNHSSYTSRFFLASLEAWGAAGGFSTAVELIRGVETEPAPSEDAAHNRHMALLPFDAVQNVLRLVYNAKDHLRPEFLATYLPPLSHGVGVWMERMTLHELSVIPRDAVLELVHVLELLLAQVQQQSARSRLTAWSSSVGDDSDDQSKALDAEATQRQLHLLRLDVLFAFFSSSSLEKRIYGFTETIALVTRLYNGQVQEQDDPTADSLRQALGYLVDWMERRRLVEELLGEKLHVELVKRATPLFQFASELECLSSEWLDCVWRSYQGGNQDAVWSEATSTVTTTESPSLQRHAALRAPMHGLLLELVEFVDLSLLEHLLCRLERVPGRAFDETHLSLATAIALRPFEVEDETSEATTTVFPLRERVVLHLWEAVLPTQDGLEVQEQVLAQIPEILRHSAASAGDGRYAASPRVSLTGKLLEDCVANITRRERVPVSLQMLTQIARLASDGSVETPERQDAAGTYVELVLDELAAFKVETKGALEAVELDGLRAEELRALPLVVDYLERVKTGLFALKGAWTLDCAEDNETSFGQSQAGKLWDLLASHAIVADEASLCFHWIKFCLKSTADDASGIELSYFDVAQFLLTTKFPTLEGEAVSMSALSCFHALFSAVNLANGALQTFVVEPAADENVSATDATDKTTVNLVASPRDLVGLDELWHLTMHATDPRVAEECVTLLVGCCLDVVPSLRDSEALLRSKRDLVERCMSQLRPVKSDPTADDQDGELNAVDRCLDLLRYFLETCKAQESAVGERDAFDSLEESLPFLDVYPSPMKVSSFTEHSVFGTARRPSWIFRQQHHTILDSIIDEREAATPSLDQQSGGDGPQLSDLVLRSLSFDRDALSVVIPPPPGHGASDLRSPMLRPRASLMYPPSPSPQRGPILSVDDIGLILIESDPTTETAQRGSQADRRSSKYDDMSHLLANEGSYFQTLLELVDCGGPATARRTWELLCLLPSNNELLRKMIRLRPAADGLVGANRVDWDDLLSAPHVYRLVYALRLVEALLIPLDGDGLSCPNVSSSADVARRQWRERFVRLGGAKHLHDVLLDWSQQDQDTSSADDCSERVYRLNLRATCLAGMIRTVDYFFKLDASSWLGDARRRSLSEFDARLARSTLPEFLHAINAPVLFRAMSKLSIEICLTTGDLSDEAEEVILAGAEVCCSLVRLEPAQVLESVRDGSDGDQHVRDWLKALLVDCPRTTARDKTLATLLRLPSASSSVGVAQFVDLMRNAGCVAMALVSYAEVADCDQLLAFCCRLLVRCSGDPFASVVDTTVEVVDSLVANLCAHISGTRASASHVPGSLMKLLTVMAQHSATVRTHLLRCQADASENTTETTTLEEKSAWLALVMKRFIFAGSESDDDGELVDSTARPSARDRSSAQALVTSILFPTEKEGDSHQLAGTRRAAIQLLLASQQRFLAMVTRELDDMGRPWNYTPSNSLKSSATRSGLVNPGCVCYMNALLQQLFMMPAFFAGLLKLNCSGSDTTSDATQWCEEVRELQHLFAALGFTTKQSCDPTAFALSHKDLDGNATDLRTQMDADEFFCLLLDRLETFITRSSASGSSPNSAGSDGTHFLDECFGGVLVNQILTESGHLSEREERFFALSLEVTRKRQLADSLALYVQGEPLDGENAYFCERAQRKVSATKRICVKTLPQTLVCHLKRFEFDFDSMEKVKINDCLEFPMEIDMFPYTSAAAADTTTTNTKTESMYDLVGVVVHSGTSDMGHYYSFVKNRRKETPTTSNGDWLEFNDEVVRPFDLEDMADECFGGDELRQRWDPAQGGFVSAVETKRRSAYMLIYERRQTESSPKHGGGASAALGATCTARTAFCPDVKALVDSILHENQRLDGVVHAFEDMYESFVAKIVRGMSSDALALFDDEGESMRLALQCACEFFFGLRALGGSRRPVISGDDPERDDRSTLTTVVDSTCGWLAGYSSSSEPAIGCAEDDQRVQFCSWFLDKLVEIVPSSGRGRASRDEHTRSWLFDVLFLSEAGPDLPGNCLQVLAAAVEVAVRFLIKPEAEVEENGKQLMLAKLSAIVGALLDAVDTRHQELVVHEPLSDGGAMIEASKTHSAAVATAEALERIVCVLPDSLGSELATRSSQSVLYTVFVVQADFFSRFLTSMETMVDRSNLTQQSGTDRLADQPTTELSLSTLAIERRVFVELLCWQQEAAGDSSSDLLVHLDTLLRRSVVKGLVLAGCEGILSLFALQIAHHGSNAECDRIVSLLLTVLEDLRSSSYANKVLRVMEDVLTSQSGANNDEEAGSSRNRHIVESLFSPAHGLLEAAAYYKDRVGDRAHAFALLRLVIDNASSSLVLRELFAENPEWQRQVAWLVVWVVHYVDPTGAITRGKREEDDGEDGSLAEFDAENHPLSAREALELFSRMEAGLNISVFTDEDDEDASEGVEAGKKVIATAKAARRRADEGSSDENQGESPDVPSEWPMARKEAAAQQPEDNEGDRDRDESGGRSTTSSLRTKTPRLTLDLSCTYINYSEA